MIAVVDANLALLDEALDAVRAQQQAGRVSVLGVQRFEAERLKVESRRFDLLQRRVESENQLNLLCGRAPRPVAPSADGFLDRPLTDLDAGLPAQVLTRRPDVRQAELGLAAAKLDVKVARARFLPSLSIDADLGISAFNPAKFASMPASLLYNVAAGLLSPLFNRAEIKADWIASNARQMAAVARYEQTVLLAVVDVANHLAAIHNADAAFQTRSTQVARLAEAVETSNLLFRSARADYLEVLTTRREALEAELERVETRQQQLVARVDLYRALGGGWPSAAPPPTFTVGARAPRGAP
jgi:multidrug efflux system outer membrane protein